MRLPLPGYPRAGGTLGFIGRYDEPRKGMQVLIEALGHLIDDRPGLRLLVAGRGDADEFRAALPPPVTARIDLLGQVSEDDKARMLRSVDVYCAPNTGQESFGIILLEALAAETPIVASDLDAFKQVLHGGEVGQLFPVGDATALGAGAWRRCSTTSPGDAAGRGGREGGGAVRLAGDRRAGHAGVRGGDLGYVGRGDAEPGVYDERRCPRPVGLPLLIVAFLAVVCAVWIAFTASRLDRLHARLDAAQSALDAQLVRRVAALRHASEIGPAVSVLTDAERHGSKPSPRSP